MIRLVAAVVAVSGVMAGQATIAVDPVVVEERAGVYHVNVAFQVPQPVSIVRGVLTDYEGIPRFMPDVKSSVVVERAPRLLVRQKAVSKFSVFSQSVVLVLEITDTPNGLHFVDRHGESFASYEGSWTFVPEGDYTLITYALKAKPSFSVPEFMLKRLMRRNAGEMIEGIKLEMARRQR